LQLPFNRRVAEAVLYADNDRVFSRDAPKSLNVSDAVIALERMGLVRLSANPHGGSVMVHLVEFGPTAALLKEKIRNVLLHRFVETNHNIHHISTPTITHPESLSKPSLRIAYTNIFAICNHCTVENTLDEIVRSLSLQHKVPQYKETSTTQSHTEWLSTLQQFYQDECQEHAQCTSCGSHALSQLQSFDPSLFFRSIRSLRNVVENFDNDINDLHNEIPHNMTLFSGAKNSDFVNQQFIDELKGKQILREEVDYDNDDDNDNFDIGESSHGMIRTDDLLSLSGPTALFNPIVHAKEGKRLMTFLKYTSLPSAMESIGNVLSHTATSLPLTISQTTKLYSSPKQITRFNPSTTLSPRAILNQTGLRLARYESDVISLTSLVDGSQVKSTIEAQSSLFMNIMTTLFGFRFGPKQSTNNKVQNLEKQIRFAENIGTNEINNSNNSNNSHQNISSKKIQPQIDQNYPKDFTKSPNQLTNFLSYMNRMQVTKEDHELEKFVENYDPDTNFIIQESDDESTPPPTTPTLPLIQQSPFNRPLTLFPNFTSPLNPEQNPLLKTFRTNTKGIKKSPIMVLPPIKSRGLQVIESTPVSRTSQFSPNYSVDFITNSIGFKRSIMNVQAFTHDLYTYYHGTKRLPLHFIPPPQPVAPPVKPSAVPGQGVVEADSVDVDPVEVKKVQRKEVGKDREGVEGHATSFLFKMFSNNKAIEEFNSETKSEKTNKKRGQKLNNLEKSEELGMTDLPKQRLPPQKAQFYDMAGDSNNETNVPNEVKNDELDALFDISENETVATPSNNSDTNSPQPSHPAQPAQPPNSRFQKSYFPVNPFSRVQQQHPLTMSVDPSNAPSLPFDPTYNNTNSTHSVLEILNKNDKKQTLDPLLLLNDQNNHPTRNKFLILPSTVHTTINLDDLTLSILLSSVRAQSYVTHIGDNQNRYFLDLPIGLEPHTLTLLTRDFSPHDPTQPSTYFFHQLSQFCKVNWLPDRPNHAFERLYTPSDHMGIPLVVRYYPQGRLCQIRSKLTMKSIFLDQDEFVRRLNHGDTFQNI
jgi:hypothetical protein